MLKILLAGVLLVTACGDDAAPTAPDGGADARVDAVPDARSRPDADDTPIACAQCTDYCPVPACQPDGVHCTCTAPSGEWFACTGAGPRD